VDRSRDAETNHPGQNEAENQSECADDRHDNLGALRFRGGFGRELLLGRDGAALELGGPLADRRADVVESLGPKGIPLLHGLAQGSEALPILVEERADCCERLRACRVLYTPGNGFEVFHGVGQLAFGPIGVGLAVGEHKVGDVNARHQQVFLHLPGSACALEILIFHRRFDDGRQAFADLRADHIENLAHEPVSLLHELDESLKALHEDFHGAGDPRHQLRPLGQMDFLLGLCDFLFDLMQVFARRLEIVAAARAEVFARIQESLGHVGVDLRGDQRVSGQSSKAWKRSPASHSWMPPKATAPAMTASARNTPPRTRVRMERLARDCISYVLACNVWAKHNTAKRFKDDARACRQRRATHPR
jgi:hypothetical protein